MFIHPCQPFTVYPTVPSVIDDVKLGAAAIFSQSIGATDGSKFIGSISFVPITKAPPANQFWGINQSITYVILFLYLRLSLY